MFTNITNLYNSYCLPNITFYAGIFELLVKFVPASMPIIVIWIISGWNNLGLGRFCYWG